MFFRSEWYERTLSLGWSGDNSSFSYLSPVPWLLVITLIYIARARQEGAEAATGVIPLFLDS